MTTWNDLLGQYMSTEKGKELAVNFRKAKETAQISPIAEQTFRSYSEAICPFEQLKIVILHDEPNADPAIADGMCLSSKKQGYILPETKTWYNWMKRFAFPLLPMELFKNDYITESMFHMSRQGILMTNIRLSTYSGRPQSHLNIGWENFTHWMLMQIAIKKMEQGKPILFILLGKEAGTYKGRIVNENTDPHTCMEIDDPRLWEKNAEVSNATKQMFIVMSNFISTHYPEQAKDYDCSLVDAFDFQKVDRLWMDHVVQNRIPMPAFPEGISAQLRQSLTNLSVKFDCPGTAGFVATPMIKFKVGLNYSYR
jgi:uracil-DNA glycosylase